MPTNLLEPAPDRLLPLSVVCRLSGLTKSTIYRLVKQGRFPLAIQLTPSGRRVGWRASDVAAWANAPLDWGRPIDF